MANKLLQLKLYATALSFVFYRAGISDEVHRFESQMKGFVHSLEEGVDVMMWQMNRSDEKDSPAEFSLKASHVTVRLQRKGDLLVQGMVNFTLRGGYLSKAIGRSRGGKFFLPRTLREVCV